MPPLPRTIDLRDDLRRARETTDNDVEDDVAEILDRLDRFAEPGRPDPEGLLEDVENTLLRLEERETDETARSRFEAAGNRVEQFRDAVSTADSDVVVVRTEVKGRNDDGARVEYRRGEPVEVHATVANIGEAVAAQVQVTFLDEDRDALDAVTTRVDLGAGDEETVRLDAEIPDGAVDYAVSAGEARP